MDPLQYSEAFYFGQPRIPVAYLDDQDYVFGATQKLEKILPKVAEKGRRFIAVVNSPGAALIGDDLQRFIDAAGLPVPCLALESTGFSEGFAKGFQASAIQVLKRLAPPSMPVDGKRVNLIGLSIFHRHWDGNAAELRRPLALCGIGVNTVLCASCTIAQLTAVGAARANLMIHHEFADQLGTFLESCVQRPCLIHGAGVPIGFEETRRWIASVCESLNADPAPAVADIRKARKRAYDMLSRFNSLTGLPRRAIFALRGDGSVALPLA